MAAEGHVALYGGKEKPIGVAFEYAAAVVGVPIQDMDLGMVCADTMLLGDLRAQ